MSSVRRPHGLVCHMQCICYYHGRCECILCATEVESNLIAMGFEVTSESVVAHLPEPPSSVQQSNVKTLTTQIHARSVDSTPLTSAVCKPVTTSARSGKANIAVERGTQVSVAAAESTQQSLYQIIRQRSQLKLSTEEEQSEALSSDIDHSVVNRDSDTAATQHPQRESSVKFCLENNAFISASSAEESQCR